jgi:hypothetical protein
MSLTQCPSHAPKRNSSRFLWQWLGDTLRALPFVLGLLFVTRGEASAYTDPGTGTLIWQMVAAGFIGLMFYLRKFTTWFKTRKRDTKD